MWSSSVNVLTASNLSLAKDTTRSSCEPSSENSPSPVHACIPVPANPTSSTVGARSLRCSPNAAHQSLLCQEVRWASLLSYGVTVKLLEDLLPMEHQLSTSTVSRHVHQVAERLESELGNEQPSFITGCPAQWYELPEPAAPLVVSLDGGYVHARSKEC